ncbi:MAG: SAM-dependent methyltransferase [Betaproteobacteria bacterium]|nr:SAM-dependent methyltransferase [Betaproteobacteria bacterium]
MSFSSLSPVFLPGPTPESLARSARTSALIADEIATQGGWIPFARYMELALYAPGLGYYSGSTQKFGASGDFVTAPELTPLFAQTLAAQAEEAMRSSAPHILEAGAGSGALAADLLLELERRGALPDSYAILELSGDLRRRQEERLAAKARHLLSRVVWRDTLPVRFDGLVLANELLDALPVHIVVWREDAIYEKGVSFGQEGFFWAERPARGALLERAQAIVTEKGMDGGSEPENHLFLCELPYTSEIGLAGMAWVATWGEILGKGVVLLLDYGFPRREFYHPQRSEGTLMCHYRHRAHADPFFLPGEQDITAHVDFSALAEAATGAGMDLLGYTQQATFLLNCGLTEILARTPAEDVRRFLPLSNVVQRLISPAEMGELFKVIAFGRGIPRGKALLGFVRGDRSHVL